MDKFLDWLSARFQQPLSLLFFLLGAFLIFFGLSSGVHWGSATSVPDPQHRWLNVIIGAICCAAAVVIYYLPSASKEHPPRKGEKGGTARRFSDLLKDEDLLSPSQKEILNIFLTLSPGARISQTEITTRIQQKIDDLKTKSVSEIYYRLEQLCYMGFLTKLKSGREFLYAMSADYQDYLTKPRPLNV